MAMRGVGMTNEPRYLVYKNWNGKIHTEIQYGLHQTGDGVKVDPTEVKRIELLDHNLTLSQAIKMYPYEVENVRQ